MKQIITAAIIWLAAIGAAFAQETEWAYRNITADATTVLRRTRISAHRLREHAGRDCDDHRLR